MALKASKGDILDQLLDDKAIDDLADRLKAKLLL